jgi:hypothetical protein
LFSVFVSKSGRSGPGLKNGGKVPISISLGPVFCPKRKSDVFDIVNTTHYYEDEIHYTLGWVDIGTRTKVPLKFVTYLSKITKINEKSVLTQ